MKICSYLYLASLATLAVAPPGQAQELPSIDEYTQGLARQRGPLPAYYEPETGRVFFELQDEDDPILHVVTLSAGGTWPVDRGTIRLDEPPALLWFRRAGRIVQVIEDNPGYLARDNSSLAEVVAKSFPSAVVAALPIVALDGATWLVDGTSFLVRDAYGVGDELGWVGESVSFDPERSSVVWPGPIDSEASTDFDVRATFDVPGGAEWLEDRSPSSETLTVVQRHIFFRVPPGFDPRPADDRMGLTSVSVRDFDEGPGGGYRNGWVQRWRLLEPVEGEDREPRPLRFYLEQAIPAEYREAIRRGVDYWSRTLEAIGLPGAVHVADLPEGADPLDLRYSVVFVWAPRRQPMASMANLVVDPRTGELIKAVIQLDAHWPLVARNEYRSYRPALVAESPDEAEYVGTRVTWAAAHEVAHVIAGLSHTGHHETAVGFRLPRLSMSGDKLEIELDQVVPENPFRYDMWATSYAYQPWAPGDREALRAHVAQGLREGLGHVGYEDGLLMPEGVSRIQSPEVLEELREAMRVRSSLLSHFSTSTLDPGEPNERLFERLFPVYFHHRFALEATSRMLGGIRSKEGVDGFQPVPSQEQWLALDALVEALSPAQLAVPQQVALLMPPAPTASSRLDLRGESDQAGTFTFQTGDAAPIDIEAAPGSTFNPIAWARSLTQMTLSSMLSPLRASRLQMQVVEDPSLPTLSDVIERLLSGIWHATATDDPTDRRFQRLVRRALLEQLINLVAGDATTPAARETTLGHLSLLRQRLTPEVAGDPAEVGMIIEAIRDLDRVLSCGSEGCDEDAP
ncbi:MAG: zinc-dependent metalloprotease [Deltaproteobacteria bacterium]|nr:zinc-dependent metalloprotease [Deltaproteobacteria bacterium]